MKIAIIGANGKAGSCILNEAMERGIDVLAIARKEVVNSKKNLIKDAYDLNYDDIKDYDVIIDALGFFTPETLNNHTTSLMHLTKILADKPNRLLVVGGAGSLYVDKEHTVQVKDGEDFPEVFKPLANAQANQLLEIRNVNNVNWTYVSPAADFQADGEKTGKYILAGEEFKLNSKGESIISYKDYAVAMIDLAVNGGYNKERVSVIREA